VTLERWFRPSGDKADDRGHSPVGAVLGVAGTVVDRFSTISIAVIEPEKSSGYGIFGQRPNSAPMAERQGPTPASPTTVLAGVVLAPRSTWPPTKQGQRADGE